jgi:hypothetical protein
MPGDGVTVVRAVPVARAILPPVTLPAGNGNSCDPNASRYVISSGAQSNPVPEQNVEFAIFRWQRDDRLIVCGKL